MDQEYAYQVLQSFSDSGMQTNIWYFVMAVLLIVAALTSLILWYNNKELRKKIKNVPPSWVINANEIRNILENALLSRSKIDLSFHSETQKRKTLPCSLLDIDQEISIELPVSGQNSNIILNRDVDCFFSIPARRKGQHIFFQFTSQVTDISSSNKNSSVAKINIPEHLEQTQNREFLRVSPPSKFYDFVSIFPETPTLAKQCINYIKSNGEVTPESITGNKSKQLLADISGGGISLEITKLDTAKAKELDFAKGKNVFLLLALVDTGSKGIQRYLFICKIRRFYLDPVQGKVQMGLSFENKFEGFNEDNGKPKWINLEGHGCNDIDDWSYNVYLHLYRDGLE